MIVVELATTLELRETAFRLEMASATRGDGLHDGLDWLYQAIAKQAKYW